MPLDEGGRDVLGRLGGQSLVEHLGAKLLPPQRLGGRQVAGALRMGAVDPHAVVAVEREALALQKTGVERHLLT